MTKKKFTPIIGDLEHLNEAKRNQYVLDVCEFLGVPPELGLITLTFMDSGDGKRNLICYVGKGATDIIRNACGIDVDEATESNGPGYVGWKVKGHDKTGRHEVAVGAVSIDGLRGTAVANAVMVAHTKGMRRMTLQFAGGGFLDVTELSEKTTDIVNSSQSLASIAAQPSVGPNAQAGKDITQDSKEEPLNSAVGAIDLLGGSSEEPRKKRRNRNSISLDSEDSKVFFEALSSPPEPSEAAIKAVNEYLKTITTPPVAEVTTPIEAAKQAVIAEPEKPSDNGNLPTPEQKKEFRERLSSYVNDILPKAGFLQSEKLGSRNDKMKMFMNKMFPQANTKVLSVQQWDSLFLLLSSKIQEIGVPETVKFIDKTIGETP